MKMKCPIEGKCGGCQYLSVPYEEQLKAKQEKLNGLLGKYGKVDKIVGMKNPLNYRNKVTATFARKKDGTVYAGIYEEKSHHVLERSNCYIENELADRIINELVKMIKSFKWTVYNERSKYGLIRHAMIRTAHTTGQVMVILVTTSNILPSGKNFSRALKEKFPEITTIIQNVNDRDTTFVLGQRDIVLYGKGFIEDVLCDKKFKLSPQSFYQINSEQTEILYKKSIELAGISDTDNVIDTYCGVGTIGIIAAGYAKEVKGIELNKDAVKDAVRNAYSNHLKNIKFYQADASKFMEEMAENKEKTDVMFMDPPRNGSTEEFLKALIRLHPDRVVYISCGPDTLARDLQTLTKQGKYKVKKIVPVDMFPMTEHVETIVALHRINS